MWSLSITGHWNVSLPSGASPWNSIFGPGRRSKYNNEIPEESRIYRPKRCGYNNEYEVNSPNIQSDKKKWKVLSLTMGTIKQRFPITNIPPTNSATPKILIVKNSTTRRTKGYVPLIDVSCPLKISYILSVTSGIVYTLGLIKDYYYYCHHVCPILSLHLVFLNPVHQTRHLKRQQKVRICTMHYYCKKKKKHGTKTF